MALRNAPYAVSEHVFGVACPVSEWVSVSECISMLTYGVVHDKLSACVGVFFFYYYYVARIKQRETATRPSTQLPGGVRAQSLPNDRTRAEKKRNGVRQGCQVAHGGMYIRVCEGMECECFVGERQGE